MTRASSVVAAAIMLLGDAGPAPGVSRPGSQTTGELWIYVDAPSFLSGAKSSDYALTIDGAAAPIVRVVPGPHPVSAVAVLDASTSIRGLELGTAAKRLAGAARAGDSLRISTFADKVLLSKTVIKDDRSASLAAREVTQQGGQSPLWDALYGGLLAVQDAAGVRGVLLFSDGMATGNDRGSDDVFALAEGLGVTISAVALSDEALRSYSSMISIGRNDAMRKLAESTGGRYLELPRSNSGPQHVLPGFVDDLRKRYRIDFVPPARDGRVHQIAVTLAGRPVKAAKTLKFQGAAWRPGL